MHPGAQQEGQTYCVPFHTPAQVPRLALITCPLHWGAPFLPLGLPEQCFLHCLLLLLTGQPTAPPVCIAPSCSSLLEIFWLFLLVCNTSELSVKGPRPRKKPDGIFIGITLYINSGTQTVTMPSQADTRWLSISSLCVFRSFSQRNTHRKQALHSHAAGLAGLRPPDGTHHTDGKARLA